MSDIDLLRGQLRQVSAGQGGTRGRALIMTGRRRVGKSRLAQEFCDRSGAPYMIFQATRGRNPVAERGDFIDVIPRLTAGDSTYTDGSPRW
jgi:hypothetical protein